MNKKGYVTRKPNMRQKKKTSQQDIISQEEKRKHIEYGIERHQQKSLREMRIDQQKTSGILNMDRQREYNTCLKLLNENIFYSKTNSNRALILEGYKNHLIQNGENMSPYDLREFKRMIIKVLKNATTAENRGVSLEECEDAILDYIVNYYEQFSEIGGSFYMPYYPIMDELRSNSCHATFEQAKVYVKNMYDNLGGRRIQ